MTPERAQLIEWASALDGDDHTPNKTYCNTKVAEYLGVKTRFLHVLEDVVCAARRNLYSVHNYSKQLPLTIIGADENARSLKNIRQFLLDMPDPYAQNIWLVRWVNNDGLGHALLVDTYGETLVDTSPDEENNHVTDLYCLRKKPCE